MQPAMLSAYRLKAHLRSGCSPARTQAGTGGKYLETPFYGVVRVKVQFFRLSLSVLMVLLVAGRASAQTPSITVGPDLGTCNGTVQVALTATGGNGTYTWSLGSGHLPSGVVLRTDVPSSFPAGSYAGLIGVATTPGTYSFTLAVTSAGNAVSRNCSMKITGLR